MEEIYVYIGGYQEKGHPATWKFMGFGKPEEMLNYTIDKLVPHIKYGMDVYLKTSYQCFAYHRDLKKYPPEQIIRILKKSFT